MAKKKTLPQGAQKKSLVSKRKEIERLINVNNSMSVRPTNKQSIEPTKVRLPARQSNACIQTTSRQSYARPLYHVRRSQPPKEVIPGLPESKFLILDQRSTESPTRPLVRLPLEPTTPRALRFNRQGVFRFLDLPAELRNQIYDLAISKEHYAIEWVDNNHKTKSQTYYLPRSGAPRRTPLGAEAARRRRALDSPKGKNPEPLPGDYYEPVPTTLLLICKQMHDEAASVFYSKSAFHFHGLGALRHFLNHLTLLSRQSITKLHLTYKAYGHPRTTKDQIWKARHDRLWEDLCFRLTYGTKEDPADKCSLTHLGLDLTLNDSPISFTSFDGAINGDLGTRWIRPLWAFQDAGIQRCWARIRCATKESTVLEAGSWELRKEILGDLWDKEAEARRDAFGYEHHRKHGRPVKNTRTMVLMLGTSGMPILISGLA